MARIAILVAEGARDEEIEFLKHTLEEAEHEVRFMNTDTPFCRLGPEEFCGLILPHGRWPDGTSLDNDMKRFLRLSHIAGRPIAAFSEGVRMLLASGIGKDCTLASPESMRDLVEASGARWVASPVAAFGHILSAQSHENMQELMELFLSAVEAFQRLTPTEYLLETPPPEGGSL
jgi:putative intracellular protease/amidase